MSSIVRGDRTVCGDEENLRALIDHLGLLSEVAKHAEFTVTRQEPTFVDFSQVIGGVPVWARNEIDLGPDGRVLAARLSIVDPALAPKAQPIARARATQIASHAYAAQTGVASTEWISTTIPGCNTDRLRGASH